MENDTDKLINGQLKTLPPNLGAAIEAVPWKSLVQQIGKENALNTERVASLEQETMLIIYAFESLDNYIENISKEVGVPEEVASTIANSVAEKILNPISQKVLGAKSENKTPEPVIITKDTKEDAMKELNRRSEEIQKMQAPLVAPSAQGSGVAMTPKADIHPMIEEGEVAHTVDSKQQIVSSREPEVKKETVPLPDYRYPKGKDPYREPLS